MQGKGERRDNKVMRRRGKGERGVWVGKIREVRREVEKEEGRNVR